MTSLTPARDAILANRPTVRAAMSKEFEAGGLRKMHAELTFGINELLALHIADCRDQNVPPTECLDVMESALSNAIGTIVMSGTKDEHDRQSLWAGVMSALVDKSQRALELHEIDREGLTVSTFPSSTQVGNS